MIATMINLKRIVQILRVLARHDALLPAFSLYSNSATTLKFIRKLSKNKTSLRSGVRLTAAFQELGPSFIKLGQAMSVRSDLVGEDLAEDLSALQDSLVPFPGTTAIKIIEKEFGVPIKQLFKKFNESPVAAASIAQVHLAITTEGQNVAVKVLRPDIEVHFQKDIDLLFWLARSCERLRPSLRRLRLVEIVDTFRDTVSLELDMSFEGAAASELRENFLNDPEFRVPQVDWKRTGRRVLTTDRVEGVSIDEVEALQNSGHDLRTVLESSARAFFNQVFRDGFFHADMHPGNMFVAPDGSLVPVDFGIMGRLDEQTRFYLADMLLGFLERDYRRVSDVHFSAGYISQSQSKDAFMLACRSIGEPIFGKPLNEISIAKLLGQLFRITEKFEMQTQPQLLLLQKTMLVAEGVGRKLDASSNIWSLAKSLIEVWMIENRGPEARMRQALQKTVNEMSKIPVVMKKTEAVVDMLGDSGVRLHPDSLKALNKRNSWRWRMLFILLLLTLSVMGIFAFT